MADTGTGNTGTILQGAGAGKTPTFSTATYPATAAVSTLLYASSTDVISALATANDGVLITSHTGVPSWLANGVAGQVLTANTNLPPSWATPAAGTVTSVSGTTNRITSTGGATPVIDISASYVGQSSITTLGTITTGVWNATDIALADGGTNASLVASNGGIFYSTATAGAILSGTATANKVLMSGATAAPTWSIPTYPNASTNLGSLLQSDGTNIVASGPNKIINLTDDFIGRGQVTTTVFVSQLAWLCTASNWVLVNANQLATNPGIVSNAAIGVSASTLILNGASTLYGFILGGGEINIVWVIKTTILSNGTNRYTINVGMSDVANSSATEPANGVYFQYSDNINSGNWVGVCRSASASSSANSAVPPVTNAFTNLRININAAATSVSFFVNEVQIANSPLASNIPTTVITPSLQLIGAVGTISAGTILVDLMSYSQNLTSAR